jgi:hypothetical protein
MLSVIKKRTWNGGISLARLREISERAVADDARFTQKPAVLPPVPVVAWPADVLKKPLRVGDREFATFREAMKVLNISSLYLRRGIAKGEVVVRVKLKAEWLAARE